VHFTGQIPHADVPAHIAAMDIAVMPNSNAFGSPVKIFEYMAMRRAIIAPRCGPVEEVLEDGKTALIVTPGDSGQLIDAIERLAQEPDLRHRLGHAAREAFIARHTWEHNAKRTFAILNDAISQG
jgi:glycosyltransferase involved in cell wall biosynthesis